MAVLALACGGSDDRPPDILLVTIDTLRADHLGLYGYPRATSPHIDRIFAGGAIFERAYSTDALRRMEEHQDSINAWRGCGPFTLVDVNDGRTVFDTPFAPETDPDSEDLRWVTVKTVFEGNQRINLESTFGRLDYCSAYVRTIVLSPREQEVRIEWSVDDYIKGWINGQPIERGRITLHKGPNRLMLKVGDHGGGWNFNCRLLTPEGHPVVDGLRYVLKLAP